MRSLWPPIEVIARNLQGGTGEPLHFPDKEDAVDSITNTASAEMPVFIRDKIRHRVASRNTKFATQPKAGQIWRFDGDQENIAPLCVLLDHRQDDNHWMGWLTAAETDYATHQDVLLEPQDEPFDPLAGMLQTWNPVTVDLRKGNRVLAQLASHRLDTIREVASGKCEEGGGARPGFVAPLKTQSGATVLAGTRITHPEDPRRRYQALYMSAAQALEQQHFTAKVILLPYRQRIWRNVGWSLAASVLLAQAAIIANLIRSQPDKSIEEQINRISEYRSVPLPPASYAYLEVNFKPDAKELDIRKLLVKLNASIVDGPGEFGQYRVKILAENVVKADLVMNQSGLVDSVLKLN